MRINDDNSWRTKTQNWEWEKANKRATLKLKGSKRKKEEKISGINLQKNDLPCDLHSTEAGEFHEKMLAFRSIQKQRYRAEVVKRHFIKLNKNYLK